MSELKDFDWFLERLTPAKWEDEARGSRSMLANCPVHGGSDSLHVTEKNGKALIKCFACGGKYGEIVESLESADESVDAEEPAEATAQRAHFHLQKHLQAEPAEATAQQSVLDPIDWYSTYCGVDRALIESLGVEATSDGWVRHTWPHLGVAKDRKPGTADRRWVPKGANQPRLWPALPLAEEIWLAEGESDVIVLRSYGLDAFTSGGAEQTLTAEEMRALAERGVARVVLAYDADKAGLKARSATLKAAEEAGLGVSTAVLGDPIWGGPKDWRERHLGGDRAVPQTTATLAAKEVWKLGDIQPAPPLKLILDRLHPDDQTILFGDGGTGKGVVAAWWAARMANELGMRVLVVDYEEHAKHEWRPRVERFGGAAALDKVFIYQPQKQVWNEAAGILAMCEELGIDYVIVDSVTYAVAPEEAEKSVTATKYTDAVRVWKRPTLSLAHTTKADDDPQHPFGSAYWSNGARVTIGIAKTEKKIDAPRKLEFKKANQGGTSYPTEIKWDWVTKDLPATLTEAASTGDTVDRIYAALVRLAGKGKLDEIYAEVLRDGGDDISKFTIRNRMDANPGMFKKGGGGRGVYALAGDGGGTSA